MNMLRATSLIPLLALLPACVPGKVCIGDCPELGGDADASDANAGVATYTATSTASAGTTTDPSEASTTAAPETDSDSDVTTTHPGAETGLDPECMFEIVNDFDPLQGCGDGVQNPREMCFIEGSGAGSFPQMLSAVPVQIDGGAVDVLVSQGDRSVSAMLDGPDPIYDPTRVDWQFQTPNGNFLLTAAGDLDEDGVQDVVGRHYTDVFGEESIHILTLTPGGDLKVNQNFGIGLIQDGPFVVDWNGDDHLDVVVTGTLVGEQLQTVLPFLGDGAGQFTASPQALEIDDEPIHYAVGDLDGDGAEDDIAVTRGDGNILVISAPPGENLVPLPNGADPRDLQIADLDGDGLGDLVVEYDDLAFDGTSHVGVFIQSPGDDGAFFAFTEYGVLCHASALALGDIDGDGALDIVTGGRLDTRGAILRGDGHGGFPEAITVNLSRPAERLYVADFNGNGAADILSVDLAGGVLGVAENTP